MSRNLISDDDDDDLDRPSPLLQTQRFTKPGSIGTKNFSMTQTIPKYNEKSDFKINLKKINDDDNDDDSLNTSDDDTTTKTDRSSSTATTSQLTPKPKERSFLKKDTEKPKVKPRHTGISDDDDDDNERNVFGKTKIEPSPRHQILTRHEEEERNQSFMQTFANDKKRKSPTDMFSIDRISDTQKTRSKFSNDHDNKKPIDSDDEILSNRQSKAHKDFIKSQHSSTSIDQLQTQKHSSRSKESIDQSDNDDDFSKKQSQRQSFGKEKQLSHELMQDTNSNIIQNQLSSSRPGSASKKEVESARRSSYCEDQESIIPSTNQKPQSRPTSAKSNTIRQQTQSAIDTITSANIPPTLDPLTSNNEALAAALQPQPPPSPPPRSSANLPPRPKLSSKKATIGGINKKEKYKVPSRYQEITSRVDTGRKSVSTMDLSQSIERALKKELQLQTLPRPQSARSRKQSATSNHSGGSQRRRSLSAYEHVQPRINTHRSINFDELDTSQLRNDSSQSIKDAVYLEWLKNKENRKKHEKEELKRWQEEKIKLVDKSTVERRIRQDAQKLERWRQEKEKEIIQKKREENEFRRRQKELEISKRIEKQKDSKAGYQQWKEQKDEVLKEQIQEQHNKKTEIEQRQEEKQKKILEAAKAYEKWNNKKIEQTKKFSETKKHIQEDQLKKLHENEETKFISAQEAYEKWLQEKDKYEIEEKLNTKRRNSLTNKQQQVPFLPGGSQKNTGKIRHHVW
ncbi:unnamed protein product [Rotaria sp. Silwood1]|nr:unnamed protein product [Rotaria sp. Silwood1]